MKKLVRRLKIALLDDKLRYPWERVYHWVMETDEEHASGGRGFVVFLMVIVAVVLFMAWLSSLFSPP